MASFNKVILIGNFVADPELKTTQSGVSVTSFRIAVQRRYAKETDAVKADFIDVVAWRQTAEFVAKYFSKGRPILVEGSLQTRSYTAQDGNKRFVTEVVADNCGFVESRSSSETFRENRTFGAAGGTYYGGAEPTRVDQPGQVPAANFEEVSAEDDLPF